MVAYLQHDGQLTFTVRVVPRASRSEIVGEHDGTLRVRLAAPPVDGAANEALVRLLAEAFNTSRDAISIVSGKSSKLKRVGVRGVSSDALLTLARTK